MPLKKSQGNMYDWVTHTHTHLRGKCPHNCSYCYVTAATKRFGGTAYTGEVRLDEKEFNVKYGSGKTIFIENCHDLFAAGVPCDLITCILQHCRCWPDNTYVIQTKNPGRVHDFVPLLPDNTLLGTTIETNRLMDDISQAPPPFDRAYSLATLSPHIRRFVTVEPILDFDMRELADLIICTKPEFVNIGADSKGHGLVEPSIEKVDELAGVLKSRGIEIREKRNLGRLMMRKGGA